MITDFKEIKLEKVDVEPIALDIAKILKENLPMIKSIKILKSLDYGGRFKIELIFPKPALSMASQKIEGLNIILTSLRKTINPDYADNWEEIGLKD